MLLFFRGDDPFQPLTICGVLSRSAEVYWAAPATFATVGLVGAVPGFFAQWLLPAIALHRLISDINEVSDVNDDSAFDPRVLVAPMLMSLLLALLSLAAMVVFGIVVKVTIIRSTVRIFVGAHHQQQQHQNQQGQAHAPVLEADALIKDLYHGVTLVPHMLRLQIVFFCAVFCTMLILGIATVIVAVILSKLVNEEAAMVLSFAVLWAVQLVIFYVVFTTLLWDITLVVEGLPGLQPFLRSYNLVRRQCCFVFCALFVASSVVHVVLLVSLVLFGLLLALFAVVGQALIGLLIFPFFQVLVGVLVVPYATILLTVLYINARVANATAAACDNREPFDGNILARNMGWSTEEETGGVEVSCLLPEAQWEGGCKDVTL